MYLDINYILSQRVELQAQSIKWVSLRPKFDSFINKTGLHQRMRAGFDIQSDTTKGKKSGSNRSFTLPV